jgi:hypothetical protein
MGFRGLVVAAAVGAGIVVACSDDDARAPVRYPEQGDGGPTGTSSSSSSSSGGTSSGGPRPIAHDYCGVLLAYIDSILKCCTDAEKTEVGADGNLQFARAIYQQYLCPTITSSVGSGRMRLDKAAEATCVGYIEDALAKASCPWTIDPGQATRAAAASDACKKLYVGTGAENAACKGDHECADGLTCVGWTPDGDGTCKQPPALGEACGSGRSDGGAAKPSVELPFGVHAKCAPGGYCAPDRTCTAQFAQGEFCGGDSVCANGLKCYQEKCGGPGPSDTGGPCLSTDDCKDDLYCTSRDAGTCQPKKANGQPCEVNDACKSRCVVPDGGATGTCTAYCYE